MPSDETPKSFLFATWEGGGSVTPALTVVRKLVERGHRVRVMSDRCNRPESEAAGASFVPWTRAPSRASRSRDTEIQQDWAASTPVEGLMQVMDTVWTGPALAYAQDVIEELKREPADLVVASEFLFGVATGCLAAGQNLALLAVNISLLPLPGVPPMGPGLAPARTEAEHALHAEIAQGTQALFAYALPALNAARERLGLPPTASLLDQARASGRLLLATSRAFDFAPELLPEHVRYVGPQLGEPAWADPWVSPWPADDARPMLAVCFSTTFQNHAAVLRRVADACAGLQVRAVITLGDAILPGEVQGPENVYLVHSAPHDALMQAARLVVTHGGHGTVTRALTHRKPMLLIPHGRDQHDNAIRVTERGAGLSLAPTASAAEIRHALQRLLEEPAFVQAAEGLGAAVADEVVRSPVVSELEALAAAQPSAKSPLCAA